MNRGRPTKYDPRYVDEVDAYLAETGKEQTHLPKKESFALRIGVNGDTLVEWAKKYPDFSAALAKIDLRQKEQLVDDGIYGGKEVNATIVKLLLMNNHGMKERSDHTTDDKPIQPFSDEQADRIAGRISGGKRTPGGASGEEITD